MTETSGREKVLEDARPDAARLLRDALPYVRDAGQDGNVRWQGLIADIEEALSDHDALGRGVNIEAIERAREHVVIAIAFLNRDHGTGRATKTVPQIVNGLVKADEILSAALASPSTQEPLLRGGKVEEIARGIADRFFNVGYAGREHPEGAPSKGLCKQTYEGLQDDIAAALRTHAEESAAQSERAGLERAAEWHDEQAKEYRERAKENCLPGPYAIAINHEAAAKALRALSTARKAGGE